MDDIAEVLGNEIVEPIVEPIVGEQVVEPEDEPTVYIATEAPTEGTNLCQTYNRFGTILAGAEVKLADRRVLVSDYQGEVRIPFGVSFTSDHVVK